VPKKGHAHYCVCDFSIELEHDLDVRSPLKRRSRVAHGLSCPSTAGSEGFAAPEGTTLSDSRRAPHPRRSMEPSQHFPCEKMRQLRLHSEVRMSPTPLIHR